MHREKYVLRFLKSQCNYVKNLWKPKCLCTIKHLKSMGIENSYYQNKDSLSTRFSTCMHHNVHPKTDLDIAAVQNKWKTMFAIISITSSCTEFYC